MKILRFHDELIDLIKSDKKKATTRIGKRKFTAGQVINYADSQNKIHGCLKITKVEYLTINDISDDLARIENLPSAEVLKQKLREIYADRVDKEPLTVIYFELVSSTA